MFIILIFGLFFKLSNSKLHFDLDSRTRIWLINIYIIVCSFVYIKGYAHFLHIILISIRKRVKHFSLSTFITLRSQQKRQLNIKGGRCKRHRSHVQNMFMTLCWKEWRKTVVYNSLQVKVQQKRRGIHKNNLTLDNLIKHYKQIVHSILKFLNHKNVNQCEI